MQAFAQRYTAASRQSAASAGAPVFVRPNWPNRWRASRPSAPMSYWIWPASRSGRSSSSRGFGAIFEQNPVRAGLVPGACEYRWSSAWATRGSHADLGVRPTLP